MNEQLPEGATVLESDQIEELKQELTGNVLFRKCRGKMGALVDVLEKLLEASNNPSELLGRYDELVAAGRVFASTLGKLKRERRLLAAKELLRALKDDSHFFWGEEIPLEETEPFTLVVVDPEKVFAFARVCHQLAAHKLVGVSPDTCPYFELQELFRAWPKLAREMIAPWSGGDDVWWADVCAEYIHGLSLHDSIIRKFNEPPPSGVSHIVPLHLRNMKLNQPRMSKEPEIGYLVRGTDQATVLSWFSRAEQLTLTTWQLSLPRVWSENGFCNIHLGLHPEKEHADLQKRFPMFTSKGVAAGYGVLVIADIMPGKCYPSNDDSVTHDYWHNARTKKRLILS